MLNALFTQKLLLLSLGACLSYMGIAQVPDRAHAQTSQCSHLDGNWAWDTRAFTANLVPANSDGIEGSISAIDRSRSIAATWQCNPNTETVVISWDTGIVDTLTVSSNSLVGTNSNGSKLVVIKRADDDTGTVAGGCPDGIVGNWAWDNRAFPATIFSNGTVVANDNRNLITAQWTCLDAAARRIQVNWSTGYVDTLELSSDGSRLIGGNTNRSFEVRRRE